MPRSHSKSLTRTKLFLSEPPGASYRKERVKSGTVVSAWICVGRVSVRGIRVSWIRIDIGGVCISIGGIRDR